MFKKKNIGWLILAVVILISFFTVRLFIQQGQFQTIKSQSEYACKAIEAPYGPEDMFADYDNGMLYISASPRHDEKTRFATDGGIYVLDMNANDDKITPMMADLNERFRPHGISLFTLKDGAKRLFVINHPAKNQSTVEVFDLVAEQLQHVKTVNGLEGNYNSIVAIDETRFYATQDGSGQGVLSVIKGVFGLEHAEIIYYDGQKLNVVADGFVYANGIELSEDGQQLYVTDMLNRTLEFFDRDVETNALVKTGDLYMDAGVDNIRRNPDGSFLIGGHPKMFSTLFYQLGLTDIAPSVVFHAVPPKDDQGGELRVVYLDDGTQFSGASGAVRYGDKMYVASIRDNRILSCTKN
ncbi:MAG: hypothetical protein COB24_07135 [Hyphomicrobiales bacterium]|nr:MAG: hypothetical protein COB24_07135 [Hyphomicrobiales bacterium]